MNKVLVFLMTFYCFISFSTNIIATDTNNTPQIQSEANVLNFEIKIILKLDSPEMIINSVTQEIDPGRGTVPIVDDESGRTLVPIRAITEVLGGEITWDESENRVEVRCKNQIIKLWVNRRLATVDGVITPLDTAPKMINERTFIPLRFVSENLGCQVNWNSDTNEITVLYAQ